jgi:sigma-B regulation protein RsbU (phosphoserine phosphatase)
LERELETAREIQASFLPQTTPSHSSWDIGVTWRQAREVGGDFYDFIALPGDGEAERWGIVIADVSDKGIPAALYMALCRTLMRSVAYANIDPAITLEQVNRLLIQDTHADLFVSMFYGIWYPQKGEVFYANAGHHPPLVITPHYPSSSLTSHGIVLGVQDDAEYPQEKIQLSPGQLLVLYTDGVTEAFNSDDEMFGVHRLENLVLGAGNLSAQAIADRIEERVVDYCGRSDLPDDLTAVVLQHRNPDS